MNTIFPEVARSMDASFKAQQAIAQNLANLSTPGYKRSDFGVESFKTRLSQSLAKDQLQYSVPRLRVGIDYRQGPIHETGNPLDIALKGEGFLKVQTPDGVRYTRNGSLRINTNGELVTQVGHPLAIKNSTAPINPAGGEIKVGNDGKIYQGAVALGQFDIVNFRDTDQLVPQGAGLFNKTNNAQEEPSAAEVIHKAIESSNVNPVQEFIEMLNMNRKFEAVTKILEGVDSLQRRLVQG